MSERYVPTTDEIRHDFAYCQDWRVNLRQEEFDRWLNSIKAEAWEEGYEAARLTDYLGERNPYKGG